MVATRSEQTAATRALLRTTAERLYALHGIDAVSSRQISKAAGQRNNYAVGHHFGDRTGLISAILRNHNSKIEECRLRELDRLPARPSIRDWIRCLVRPEMEYLGNLGEPSHYARFCAHVDANPATTPLLYASVDESTALTDALQGFFAALPTLSDTILSARITMSQHMTVYTLAEFERPLDDPDITSGRRAGAWSHHCETLVDATVGLWLAPTTHH